jgi:hypothetical protein
MNKDVIAAFGGLDKTKTLSRIEPLYCTFGHDALPGRKLISRCEVFTPHKTIVYLGSSGRDQRFAARAGNLQIPLA